LAAQWRTDVSIRCDPERGIKTILEQLDFVRSAAHDTDRAGIVDAVDTVTVYWSPTVPSISVIVPTFNSEGLIIETLQAIFAQTLPPAEVIVVDDGSMDDTEQILRSFPVRYYRVENGGPGRARNAGVALATSEWIGFCDHDDLWRPKYLERFAANLNAASFYGFANWVDLIGDVWTSQEKFSAAPVGFFARLDQPLYPQMIKFVPVWPSATLIRKDFFLRIGGFNPKFSRFATEDFEFALRCNEHAPAVVMCEALVGIRKHRGNYSGGRVRQFLSDASILEWARDHHATGRTLRPEIDRSVVERRLGALNEAFLSGDTAMVRDIAALLPANAIPTKARMKVMLAKSRVVPGSLLRRMFGRSGQDEPPGKYAVVPATQQ
jgi:glycosyltransferase involved in cell wall biosynthesis